MSGRCFARVFNCAPSYTENNIHVIKPMKLTDLLPREPTHPVVDPAQQKILLIAAPKFGKSTWCASFPKPIFLCTEEGHDALNIYRISIDRWDWVGDDAPTDLDKRMPLDERGVRRMSFVDALSILGGKNDFGTVVVDTLPRLYQMVTDYVCQKKGIEHPSDEGYARAWHAIRDEFSRAVLRLCRLNKGVIFLSHVKHRDIENTKVGSKVTRAEATIPDACRAIIEPEVNIILHGGWDEDKDGKACRVWKCLPSENYRECGDRTGCIPKQFPCEKVGGYDTFASFFRDPATKTTKTKKGKV